MAHTHNKFDGGLIMSKATKHKKSKVPVIGEREYAAYIELLRNEGGGNGDDTLSGAENTAAANDAFKHNKN